MSHYFDDIHTSWKDVLKTLWADNVDFNNLMQEIKNRYDTSIVYPPYQQIFRCFSYCDVKQTKVVIIGQDPYYRPNQANGLAFSVNNGIKLPPSLKNIFSELKNDLGIMRTNSDLSGWAKQGVLLMNGALTVKANIPMSHSDLHWEKYTDQIIQYLSSHYQNIVYILWGKYAQTKKTLIDANHNLILCAAHPSPLSAYHGFFGSHPFSITNDYLKKHQIPPIDWAK